MWHLIGVPSLKVGDSHLLRERGQETRGHAVTLPMAQPLSPRSAAQGVFVPKAAPKPRCASYLISLPSVKF